MPALSPLTNAPPMAKVIQLDGSEASAGAAGVSPEPARAMVMVIISADAASGSRPWRRIWETFEKMEKLEDFMFLVI